MKEYLMRNSEVVFGLHNYNTICSSIILVYTFLKVNFTYFKNMIEISEVLRMLYYKELHSIYFI